MREISKVTDFINGSLHPSTIFFSFSDSMIGLTECQS